MSGLSDAIDLGVSVIGAAAKVSPLIASWVHGAIEAQPDHPISRRVAEVLPAKSAARTALEDLERGTDRGSSP